MKYLFLLFICLFAVFLSPPDAAAFGLIGVVGMGMGMVMFSPDAGGSYADQANQEAALQDPTNEELDEMLKELQERDDQLKVPNFLATPVGLNDRRRWILQQYNQKASKDLLSVDEQEEASTDANSESDNNPNPVDTPSQSAP